MRPPRRALRGAARPIAHIPRKEHENAAAESAYYNCHSDRSFVILVSHGSSPMRAAVLHDIRDIRLADIPRPEPRDGDVLVQVKAVGVCGSDLHSYLEGGTTGRAKVVPYVLGHELSGIVLPEFAAQSGLAAGTLVAVDPARPCMKCEWCHRGHTNLCPHVRFLGYAPTNGALAEFVSVAPSA